MHSHDRTMLQQLGFADPDKGKPEHDDACHYLCQPHVSNVLRAMLFKEQEGPFDIQSRTEVMLSKGEKQYRVTVGFVDVATFVVGVENEPGRPGTTPYSWASARLIVTEVKTTPISIGTAIRQVKLYREFVHSIPVPTTNLCGRRRPEFVDASFVLATTFPITRRDQDLLSQERINHVLLGDSFKKWRESNEAATVVCSPEI